MDHEGYVRAAKYWQRIDEKSRKMEKAALLAAVNEYIAKNNTCALATGAGDFVRCTPIEYSYHDGAFWLFSEGGEKFIALEKNKNVCLAIYEKYGGFAGIKGMQVMGVAEIVDPFSPEYVAAAEFKKIPLDVLKKLPEPMALIKITPQRIDFLNSDFKKDGYSSRQELILS